MHFWRSWKSNTWIPFLSDYMDREVPEVSFDDITQGCEGIKQSFDARATGAKDVCAAMFYDFYPVIEIYGLSRRMSTTY